MYNNFLPMTKIPHQIISHLISSKSESAESIWKILKYNEIDCLSKPNLTFQEKNELRYLGQGQQEGKKIFLKPLVSESLTNADNQTIIKLYRFVTQPDNHLTATINFAFEFLTNETTSLVLYEDCYVEKTDLMEALWLDLFNGKDIGIGSSCLQFNRELSRSSQSLLDINNSKSFYGRHIIMSLRYMNAQGGDTCD